MCGRFAQAQPVIRYARALDMEWTPAPLDSKPTWNMAPSRVAIVFHDTEAGHAASLFHWGLLPAWADPKGQKPINARVETAANKPYFRKAWKSGRCVIPADGWYEWKEVDKAKQPYFIHRSDDEPILMAGLYEFNPHANVTSFTILTMESSGELREVHDRQPVVLTAESALTWIKRDPLLDEISSPSMAPLPATQFAWYAVSTKVNSPRHDGAELVLPVEQP